MVNKPYQQAKPNNKTEQFCKSLRIVCLLIIIKQNQLLVPFWYSGRFRCTVRYKLASCFWYRRTSTASLGLGFWTTLYHVDPKDTEQSFLLEAIRHCGRFAIWQVPNFSLQLKALMVYAFLFQALLFCRDYAMPKDCFYTFRADFKRGLSVELLSHIAFMSNRFLAFKLFFIALKCHTTVDGLTPNYAASFFFVWS